MFERAACNHDQNAAAHARRDRTFDIALTELALTVSLAVSIVVILALTNMSAALASTRSDLIMMEESVSTGFTTLGIIAVIAVVMAVLTILALRDVAPVHSKRGQRRTTPASRR